MFTLAQSTVEVLFALAVRGAYDAAVRPVTSGVRVALVFAAMTLRYILPVAWALTPNVAALIACLAYGCNALAERLGK